MYIIIIINNVKICSEEIGKSTTGKEEEEEREKESCSSRGERQTDIPTDRPTGRQAGRQTPNQDGMT